MSADREFCADQLARCYGQAQFDQLLQPDMKAARKELLDTLEKYSRSNQHAEQIVSRWLLTSRHRPTPFDLYQMAEQLPAEDKPPAGCDVCKGEPYVPGPNGGLDRCSCARGKWYAAHDKALTSDSWRPER